MYELYLTRELDENNYSPDGLKPVDVAVDIDDTIRKLLKLKDYNEYVVVEPDNIQYYGETFIAMHWIEWFRSF